MQTLIDPTPADLLDPLTMPGGSRLVVVTGDLGSGKTLFCRKLLDEAQQRGLDPAGLLSLPVFMGGEKTGIDLLDVAAGERRRLAVPNPQLAPDEPPLKWRFDETVVAWGNGILFVTGACDLLLIDELGPLEFLYGKGFKAAFPLIEGRQYRLCCVVIRPWMVDEATLRWPVDALVEISSRSRDSAQPF